MALNEIKPKNTPVNYTPVDDTLDGHLDGVDTALASPGGGGLTLIQTVTAVGGETQLEFTGLNGNSEDDDWIIQCDLQTESAGGDGDLLLRFNNDSTSGSYKTGSSNLTEIDTRMRVSTNAVMRGYLQIIKPKRNGSDDVVGVHLSSSYAKQSSGFIRQTGSIQDNVSDNPGGYVAVGNITSIQLFFVGDTFEAGSTIKIYRGKAF